MAPFKYPSSRCLHFEILVVVLLAIICRTVLCHGYCFEIGEMAVVAAMALPSLCRGEAAGLSRVLRNFVILSDFVRAGEAVAPAVCLLCASGSWWSGKCGFGPW
jgi:hypothetical protein